MSVELVPHSGFYRQNSSLTFNSGLLNIIRTCSQTRVWGNPRSIYAKAQIGGQREFPLVIQGRGVGVRVRASQCSLKSKSEREGADYHFYHLSSEICGPQTPPNRTAPNLKNLTAVTARAVTRTILKTQDSRLGSRHFPTPNIRLNPTNLTPPPNPPPANHLRSLIRPSQHPASVQHQAALLGDIRKFLNRFAFSRRPIGYLCMDSGSQPGKMRIRL